ncbi:MAG: hypothetical protein IPP43_08305 [Chitinophagaceae bacterium]|nr:hypothetical protein [Chitinophagaceae bacterium]
MLKLGEALAVSGNFTRAIEAKLKALKLAEKISNKTLIGDAYMNLAGFYFYQGDNAQSIIYTKKSFSFPSSYSYPHNKNCLMDFLVKHFSN